MFYQGLVFFCSLLLLASFAQADDDYPRVQVADPYLEMQTGAGSGYPVFYVVERGEWVRILKRKTEWFKVRTDRGKEGWVRREQMEQTLTPTGSKLDLPDVAEGDFVRRRWEMGISSGDFSGATIISAWSGYGFTRNLSMELSVSNVLGSYSSSLMGNVGLLAHPFPEWRFSPYFTLGTGIIQTTPKASLVQTRDRTNNTTHVGVGLRVYLAKRFIVRFDYKSLVIFSSQDDNQEINVWQIGFAAFY